MNKKYVNSKTDLADANYHSFHMDEDGILTVYLMSWQNKKIKIVFENTIQFSYKLGSITQALYEFLDGNF